MKDNNAQIFYRSTKARDQSDLWPLNWIYLLIREGSIKNS